MPYKRRNIDCSNLPESVHQLRNEDGETTLDHALRLHEKLVQSFLVEVLRSRTNLMKTQLMAACTNTDGQTFWIMSYNNQDFQVYKLPEHRVTVIKDEFPENPLSLASYGQKKSKCQFGKKKNILVKSCPTSGQTTEEIFIQAEQVSISEKLNILQEPFVISDSDTGNHLYPGKRKIEAEHKVDKESTSSSPDKERNQKRRLEHDVEVKGITQTSDDEIIVPPSKEHKRGDDLAQIEETDDEKEDIRQVRRVEDNFSENECENCTASEIEAVTYTNQDKTTK